MKNYEVKVDLRKNGTYTDGTQFPATFIISADNLKAAAPPVDEALHPHAGQQIIIHDQYFIQTYPSFRSAGTSAAQSESPVCLPPAGCSA